MKRTMSAATILKDYFGYKPGEGLTEFQKELKALSPEEKKELATLAAKELGLNLLELFKIISRPIPEEPEDQTCFKRDSGLS